MTNSNNLKLNVTNFGPIAKAEIDLRPLTVFVGPSNTGKSYMAMLIYALHRFFNGDATGPWLGYRESTFRRSTIQDMPDEDVNFMFNWMIEWLPQLNRENNYLTIPEPIASSIRPYLCIDDFWQSLANDIVRCFGIANLGRMVRHESRRSAAITLAKHSQVNSIQLDPFTYTLVVNRTKRKTLNLEYTNSNFEARIPDTAPLQVAGNTLGPQFRKDISRLHSFTGPRRERILFLTQELGSILTDLVGTTIVAPLTRPAYYLPAGRTSLMHQLRMMISSVISRSTHMVIQAQQVRPGLSGVVSDFLEQLINLHDEGEGSHVSGRSVSERLENEMLQGAIRTDVPEVGIPMFTYRPEGWKENIPLMNSSSMVSELAPVVLYLRHVVQPGEVLIIEEPESHLHPAMQVEFTRQLAAAVRSGVRVMLTTHSEWVLEELANLVRLSDLPEFQREGAGGEDVALSPDEVGVWLFEPKKRPKGSVIKEIPLDQELGGFASGYDDVAMSTYNKWARIGNLISGARNGS